MNIVNYEDHANLLYEAYKQSGNSYYTIERIKALYYGKIAYDHISIFLKLHAYLVKNGHDKNNPLWQGDADNALWYEKSKNSFTKIIADARHCSCADDYTHIYVFDDYSTPDHESDMWIPAQDVWLKFRAFTAWPRQVPAKKLLGPDHKWGDHRDIKYPSIITHRKHDFRFGYQDGRDEWYCFKYDSLSKTVEDAHWNENKMIHALRNLMSCWEEVEITTDPTDHM